MPPQARSGESSIGQGVEIKAGNFLYQPIETISAPKVQELIQLVEGTLPMAALHMAPLTVGPPSRPSRPQLSQGDVSTFARKQSCNGRRVHQLQLDHARWVGLAALIATAIFSMMGM